LCFVAMLFNDKIEKTRAKSYSTDILSYRRKDKFRSKGKKMPKRIIILDTPAKNLEALGDAFMEASGEQCTLHWVYSADRLKEKLRTGLDWDILVLDCVLGDGHQNGLELLSGIRDEWPGLPVVVVAEQGDVDIAGTWILLIRRFRRGLMIFWCGAGSWWIGCPPY